MTKQLVFPSTLSESLEEELLIPRYYLDLLIQISEKFPNAFEKDLFKSFQQYFAYTEKEFRDHRSLRHLLRIFCHHYLLGKALRYKQLDLKGSDITFRLLPTHLHFPFGKKAVVGIVIVIYLSSPYERFEDTHILSAVQKILPDVKQVKESFLSFQKTRDPLRFLYLEMEKTSKFPFSLEEISLLKQHLYGSLKKSIEQLQPSIFGINDTEETMRNILSLSKELHSPDDLPQIMISFEKAIATALIFRIIVVRALNNTSFTLSESFKQLQGVCEYVPERSSIVGKFSSDQEGMKEASVFRLHIPKQPFLLRSDGSCNFNRARAHILSLIIQALGEVRDYNGGIFSKQLELFTQFKNHFKEEKDDEFLEDFFYAIHPSEMQAILPLSALTTLFQLFLHSLTKNLPEEKSYILDTQEKEMFTFTVIRLKDLSFQERLTNSLMEVKLFSEIQAWTVVKHHDSLLLGYIYPISKEKNSLFANVFQQTLDQWRLEQNHKQILRLEMQDLPVSLDPRLGGDIFSVMLVRLLFEGLMRIDQEGKPALALANKVDISDQGKQYTFTLRKCFWNNGDLITSHDFSYSWKKILSPTFATAFAYLFYVIKNAKKAKEGKVSPEKVGIYTPDSKTFIVELEYPCPYFLELVAHPLYSPINHRIDHLHPNWPLQTGKEYTCNGPFYIQVMNQRTMVLQKNITYWDTSSVELQQIYFYRTTARQALEMFENSQIDWLGRPSRPWDPLFSERIKKSKEKLPSSVSCWCVCNTQQFPLNSRKIRLSLAYSLDREKIVQHLSEDYEPSFSPLQKLYATQQMDSKIKQKEAKSLFDEALKELGISLKEWPSITLFHGNNEMRKTIASVIARQWQEVLGITIYIEALEYPMLFKKMTQGNYALGISIWNSWVDNALYTLNTFKSGTEQINISKWENPLYQALLDQAMRETNRKKQSTLLTKAESILIEQMPIIPIAYESEFFCKTESVTGAMISKIGSIDFKKVKMQYMRNQHQK